MRDFSSAYSFAELGFKDGRSAARPDRMWGTLRLFAQHQGKLSWEDPLPQHQQDRLKTNVKELRRQLRDIFDIADDPFYEYRREKAYRLKLTLKAQP
jgi:hypothetical protein